jgi:RNA polymerase sigma factor (sigma-70 family)
VTRTAAFIQRLKHVVAPPEIKGAGDAELLERFITYRDQTAFELLVRRHEAMVLGVCRRVLRDHHDAEDAFQATFLALARKAASIRRRTAVAGWLYRVACRVALQARIDAARRAALHQLGGELESVADSPESRAEVLWRELKPILDEELSQLPEKLRVAVVLCYLQGKSYVEAAAQLGWPTGTLSGRLARARRLLATRLARRGLGMSGALLASALWAHAGSAAAQNALVKSTVVAAARLAAGEAMAQVVPLPVARLTDGVVRTMFLSRAKSIGAVLALALACLGVAGLSYRPLASGTTSPTTARSALEDRPAAPPAQRSKPEADRTEPAPTERLREQGEAVSLEFSLDGSVLAGYRWQLPQSCLILWDAVTGETIWQLPVHGQGVNSRPFAFSPDGKLVAVATLDKLILCDVTTGKEVRTFPLEVDGPIGPLLLRFSPDGKRVAVAVECDKVQVLDSVTGKRLQEVGGHHSTIFALAFSPDGKSLALGTCEPMLELWDVATGKVASGIQRRPRDVAVSAVAFSPDGTILADGRRNRIEFTEVASGKQLGILEAPMGVMTGLAFTPDGQTLVSGSTDGKVRIWNLRSRRVTGTLDGAAEGRCLALSPDGKAMALGTVRQAILWDIPSARCAPPPRAVKRTSAELADLWTDLADRDVPRAHQAITRLLTAPGETVSYFGRRLQPAIALDPKESERLRRWITELDSDSFAARETAEHDLEQVGDQAAALLRQTLADNPSPEVRRRVERLLEKAERHWPASSTESLRTWRAIKLLEHIGTTDAQQVLEKLARGAPRERLTQEAEASLGRLAKRASK